jgi:predicted transcriptional regulator
MMTLELDDETASLLQRLMAQEHIGAAQVVKNALLEHSEDRLDAQEADAAYQRYLDGGKISHSLKDVVGDLGLDG